jgi:hypothetical protein
VSYPIRQYSSQSAPENLKSNKKFWEELIAYFLGYDTDRRQILALSSKDRGILTEPLPSNDRKDTSTGTQTDGRGL